MNSALQCLRSVEELTMFFLSNSWKTDINSDNPIGHGGAIAKVYAGLLSGIYDLSAVSSFSPKNFKNTLGKANTLFSGYGQQDSQEFVSWLVDALHEDLNRIHQKPYAENPDSDDNTFRDPEAIKALGEVYRKNHKARNDSVATDLFGGEYSSLLCVNSMMHFSDAPQDSTRTPWSAQSARKSASHLTLSANSPCNFQ
jgi:ubiquitin carboxyl-terminal hydrolase 4/11/15